MFRTVVMIIFANLVFANVAGTYDIEFDGHPLFNSIRFTVDNQANLLKYEIDGDSYPLESISTNLEAIDNKESGILTLKINTLNDGLIEMTRVKIFISSDSHFEPSLMSSFWTYNDGASQVYIDKKSILSVL